MLTIMIHKSAVVEDPSLISSFVEIKEFTIVRKGTRIGEGTVVSPFVHLESDCVIGDYCFIGPHVNIRSGTVIGNNTVFGTVSQAEGDLRIGNHVRIHSCCHISRKTVIEDWVFIAPQFISGNVKRIVHGRKIPMEVEGCTVKFGARIGMGVHLMPGVIIGREAFIGSDSLVTRSIPEYAIAYGRPAVIKGTVPEEERLVVET